MVNENVLRASLQRRRHNYADALCERALNGPVYDRLGIVEPRR